MATNWVVIDGTDLLTAMSGVVVGAGQRTGSDQDDQDTQAVKVAAIIARVVARIRGAIDNGNRGPLSLTAGSVPAEGEQHALCLAVEALVASTPNLGFAAKEGFAEMLKDAKEWLKMLQCGEISAQYPNDPQLVDEAGFSTDGGGSGGDLNGTPDMTTDSLTTAPIIPTLPVGATRYSGRVDPNGVQTANINDEYFLYDVSGNLVDAFVKRGASGTNLNWVSTALL